MRKGVPAIVKARAVELSQPHQPMVPKPSKYAFVNNRTTKRLQAFNELIETATETVDKMTEHQRALGRYHNVDREIELDRQAVELEIDKTKARRRAIRAFDKYQVKQIGKGTIPDDLGEDVSLGEDADLD